MNNGQIIFKSERLEAHLLTKKNQNLLIELYNDKQNTQFLEGLNVIQDIALTYDSYEQNDVGAYLIFCNKTKNFIGFGGVQNQEPLNDGSFAFSDKIEFVIMIDAKHHWQGYAKEFSQEFLKYFFAKLPNHKIHARVNKQNLGCLKLLAKLGFVRIGEVAYYDKNNIFELLVVQN